MSSTLVSMMMRIPHARDRLVVILAGYAPFLGLCSAAGMSINSIVYRMP